MMRFRCPHCQQTLEVDQATDAILCPACEGWCRIPAQPQTAQLPDAPGRADVRSGLHPASPAPGAPSSSVQTSRPDPAPAEPPFRFQDEKDIEPVEFEIIEDGGQRRRRRKRRRPRRNPGQVGLEFASANLPLVLLVLLVPVGILLVVVAFAAHPMAGASSLFLIGGGIWLTLIAAEDGLPTALCVLFIPFYAWYYAFTNWDRVAVPFLLHLIGVVMYAFTMGMVAYRASGNDLSGRPVPVLVSRQQFAQRSAPRHQDEGTPQPVG